jgi:hypothetical protein
VGSESAIQTAEVLRTVLEVLDQRWKAGSESSLFTRKRDEAELIGEYLEILKARELIYFGEIIKWPTLLF